MVGAIGKIVKPGKNPGGLIATILIGIAGALIAGFVAETMHWAVSGVWQNYAASVAGAVAMLTVYRMIRNYWPDRPPVVHRA